MSRIYKDLITETLNTDLIKIKLYQDQEMGGQEHRCVFWGLGAE